jgi:hypothetical protein
MHPEKRVGARDEACADQRKRPFRRNSLIAAGRFL